MSGDGEAFVFHDETLDRLTDASGPSRRERRRDRESPHPRIGRAAAGLPRFSTVAGRTPDLRTQEPFQRRLALADRAAALAATYDGPLAFKSFDHDLAAYLRLRRPHMRPPRGPCPIGLLAQASYDDPDWAFLTPEQKRDWTDFDHYDLARPDFLSWNVDDLPHKIPFLVKQLTDAPTMVWTVHNAEQREAAISGRTRSCSTAIPRLTEPGGLSATRLLSGDSHRDLG